MFVGIEHILPLRQKRHRVEVVLVRTTGIETHHQFVLQAEPIELAIHVGVEAVVDLIVVVHAAQHTGGIHARRYRPGGERVFDVLGVFCVNAGDFQCPVFVDLVFEIAEDRGAFTAPGVPRRIEAG
ncbi:hypothetical protein D9M69_484760 [compost metagenome]